jgi:hypothetical protein
MAYVPTPVPTGGVTPDYLFQELLRVSAELELSAEGRNMPVRAVAPVKPREGTLAIADGTNWNPGLGAGLYEYLGGVWLQRLSDSDITAAYLIGKLGYTPDVGPLFRITGNNMASLNITWNTPNLWSGDTYITEQVDTDNAFTPSTGKFQPSVAGYYSVTAYASIGSAGTTLTQVFVYKNGVAAFSGHDIVPSIISYQMAQATDLVYLNGSTDYLQMYLRQGNPTSTTISMADGGMSFSAFLARRA